MSNMPKETKKTIGRADKLDFPELSFEGVYGRIDTGAKTSAIWASDVSISDGKLRVVFLGKGNTSYTGKPVLFEEFDRIAVASSTGHIQKRFKVRLLVKLRGKKIRAWFTLADRSTQVYPVLIGRNVLKGKFVVDVKKGHSLKEAEQQRTDELNALLNDSDEEVS